MNNKPLVSVCMITYGHEKYIKQSIESILKQQTQFEFELVIANDCSPDATDNVVQNIIKNHKKGACIRYISHDQNKGMYANFLFALSACPSKYVALCEGDDYWTDPLKLQKQVDFLDGHPEYEVCFTNINIINNENLIVKEQLIPSKRRTTFEHKHLPIWAPTLTRVFRNRDFKDKIPNVPGLDTIMLLYQSKLGKIKLINEITGTYRLHDTGIYSSKTEAQRKEQIIKTHLKSLELINLEMSSKYFGMLLKNLIELKALNYILYKTNKKNIVIAYNTNRFNLSIFERIKIRFGFLLASLPFIYRVPMIRSIFLKILNRLFIYKYKKI